jgi:hypothetical protein
LRFSTKEPIAVQNLDDAVEAYLYAMPTANVGVMRNLLHPCFRNIGTQTQCDVMSDRAQTLDFLEHYRKWSTWQASPRPTVLDKMITENLATVSVSEQSFGEKVTAHLTFVLHQKGWLLLQRSFLACVAFGFAAIFGCEVWHVIFNACPLDAFDHT